MSEENAGQAGSATGDDPPTLYGMLMSPSEPVKAVRGGLTQMLLGMLITLGAAGVSAGIFLAIFLVLRKSHRRFYAPRTYLGSIPEQ
jgi:hypothetical protein